MPVIFRMTLEQIVRQVETGTTTTETAEALRYLTSITTECPSCGRLTSIQWGDALVCERCHNATSDLVRVFDA